MFFRAVTVQDSTENNNSLGGDGGVGWCYLLPAMRTCMPLEKDT